MAARGKPTLALEGFMVRPIAHNVDYDDDGNMTVEPIPLGEQKVKPGQMIKFIEETWPEIWEKCKADWEAIRLQNEALALVEAEATGNRAVKRAAKKVAAKRPAAARLAAVASPGAEVAPR